MDTSILQTNEKGQFIKGMIPWNKGTKLTHIFWLGKKHSEESKKKMSESAKGRVAWNKGKKGIQKMSEETRQKLRLAKIGERAYQWKGGKPKCLDCGKLLSTYKVKRCRSCYPMSKRGENHWNWKNTGTKMGQKEYILWRSNVFERDLYTCQKCKKMGVYLMAHHIKQWSKYPELRYVVSNGITLCRDCHAETDKFYARFFKKEVQS